MNNLENGQKAPEFSLLDNKNHKHLLADYLGQWLVIFFYPKDNTPGCTIEACQFRDDYSDISALDTKIIGINTDSTKSHGKFIDKQNLPFPLLSDNSGTICQAYGTLFKLGPITFCKRHSFIIDPEGNIAKIYRSVSPSKHSEQIQADLKALQSEPSV